MADGKFVSYLRVSTARQGASGLGLEAQRKAVGDFLDGGRWTLVREFVEVESGKRDDRPKLAEAMALCRLHGAVLVIAKLDRLSRDRSLPARIAEGRGAVRGGRHARGERDGWSASWPSSPRPSAR